MIQRCSLPFAALFILAGNLAASRPVFAQSAARTPSHFVRSGDFLSCHPGKDCTQEIIDGRSFYVMQTEKMIVKVAVERDRRYSHIAVSVENLSGFDIHVAPADFRIEITEPTFKRLSYIEPDKLKLPKGKAAKSEAPTVSAPFASSFLGASHPESRQTAPAGPSFLTPSTLAPAQSVSGEVYFERSKEAGTMSLLLPIAGSILEFPYVPSR